MVTSERSHIICHMMSTIDGKIDSGVKGKDILGDYYNLYSHLEHTLKPDAWMCGRVTSEMFAESVGTPLLPHTQPVTPDDFIAPFTTKNFLIAVDTKGLLRWKNNTLTFGDHSVHQLIIIVTHTTPKEYLAYLKEKSISYIFGGQAVLNFEEIFKTLKKIFGINTLVLEGGGLLNGSVMAAGLVDEISLLVCPLVLNRTEAPSAFERTVEEELSVKSYTLVEVKHVEKETVWLRYKKNET